MNSNLIGLNGKTKWQFITKIGRVVQANLNGVYGSELNNTIPLEFRPSENKSACVMVADNAGNVYLGYVTFTPEGVMYGHAFGEYPGKIYTDIRQSNFLIYGGMS